MKVLNYLATAAALLCSVAAVSCSDNDEPAQPTITHIYLSVPDGKTSIADDSDETITVEVSLSAKLEQETTFTFTATGADASLLTFGDNPVTIAAGSTTGFFTVKSAKTSNVMESTSFTFAIEGLDASRFDISTNATITLLPAAGLANLTPEQKALIQGWKTTYGIDLAPWIGNITLQGTIEFPGGGVRSAFTNPETINLSGSTVFNLSSEATAEVPALDMTENPMGMTEYLYKVFRALTVGDQEYFALEDDGTGLDLMELIKWNASSTETFSASLPGLKLTNIANGKATIAFVAEGEDLILNSQGQPIVDDLMDGAYYTYAYHTSWIPFAYNFSAWNRQLGLMEQNNPTALELQSYGVTAAPACYLGLSDVLEDTWEIDEEEDGVSNLYVEPSAEIDFNAGTMKFIFPFDSADQYGYSRITVTYSIQK